MATSRKEDHMTDATEVTTPTPDNRGERNGMAKLREADIHRIYDMRSDGMTQTAIAEQLGVTQVTISAILSGTRWAHVPRRKED
jgi:predicted XRE-type DNA-binding protein